MVARTDARISRSFKTFARLSNPVEYPTKTFARSRAFTSTDISLSAFARTSAMEIVLDSVEVPRKNGGRPLILLRSKLSHRVTQ
jgi:hypothetical protein